MRKSTWLVAVGKASLLLMLFSPGVTAQTPRAGAPLPTAIGAARRVFISNTGADGIAFAALRHFDDIDQPYNSLYAAMKVWGRYELVTSPGDADVVMEIRFTSQAPPCGQPTIETGKLDLSIVDAKTRFVLWTLAEPVQGALRKATWEKNVDASVNALVTDMKGIAGTRQQQ